MKSCRRTLTGGALGSVDGGCCKPAPRSTRGPFFCLRPPFTATNRGTGGAFRSFAARGYRRSSSQTPNGKLPGVASRLAVVIFPNATAQAAPDRTAGPGGRDQPPHQPPDWARGRLRRPDDPQSRLRQRSGDPRPAHPRPRPLDDRNVRDVRPAESFDPKFIQYSTAELEVIVAGKPATIEIR